ncbi:MAG: SH3 domain-containing protein [Caldilineaceae bacterium]
MKHKLPMFIARYWIAAAVTLFALLSAYTSSPIYGQSAPPTPDVNTVPRPELLATPTNTPFPIPTPESGGGSNNGGRDDGGDNSSDRDNSNNEGNDSADTNSNDNSDQTSNPVDQERPQTGKSDDAPNSDLTGVVNVVTLNVRKGPSTGTAIVDTLFLNEEVAVLARDSGGDWWYICCGTSSGREGWVSAALITPDFTQAAAAALAVTATSSAASSTASAAEETLILEMRPSPAFAWQGQIVTLHYVIRNQGDQPYTNIRLRNDLPPTLAYLDATVEQGGTISTAGRATDGIIYTVTWPEIEAGAALTATVTVRIAENVRNGALVDNLAVVESAEGATALAGITFAMPPVRLPQFR